MFAMFIPRNFIPPWPAPAYPSASTWDPVGLAAHASLPLTTAACTPPMASVTVPAEAQPPKGGARLSKTARRRAKRKTQKQEGTSAALPVATPAPRPEREGPAAPGGDESMEVASEPLPDPQVVSMDPSIKSFFEKVLGHFAPSESSTPDPAAARAEGEEAGNGNSKGEVLYSEDEDVPPGWDEDAPPPSAPLSKRKQRKMQRLTVGELKQRVARPEVVEGWDVDAADPRTLAHLKSYHNTIPVPEHWKFKRDYLSNKRGLEKPPFKLPRTFRI